MAWSKADGTHVDFVQSRAQCRTQSEREASGYLAVVDGSRAVRFLSCMNDSGWLLTERSPGASVTW